MKYTKTIRSFEKKPDEVHTITLADMERLYKYPSKVHNQIIYQTFIKKSPPMQLGLTVINAGTINKEFFMTRGHIHAKKTPEFYILLEGKGILLMQKGNKSKAIKLKKGEIALIPENYAHRLINIGNAKLKVLTIYHEDSKPNYHVKFKKRFFRK